MDVQNLIGKLHANEDDGGSKAPSVENAKPHIPLPKKHIAVGQPNFEDHLSSNVNFHTNKASGGRNTMNDDFEGIILDLGEGISLNIPIQRRMSLTDFIKLAEKVKALEMLSENSEMYRKGHF